MNDDREAASLDWEHRLRRSEQDRDLIIMERECDKRNYENSIARFQKKIEALTAELDGALMAVKSGLIALSVANERADSCAQGLAMWEARANDLAKENEELKRRLS